MQKNNTPNTTANDKGYRLSTWFVSMHRMLPNFLWTFLGFSLAINILLMVSPLYMLQIYDRVLASGSTDTLIWLTVIAVFLMGIYAAAEAGRRRICTLAAEEIEEKISNRIFTEFDKQHQSETKLSSDLMILARIRSVFQNQLITPFFDLPFAPLFFLILFLVHPVIGTLGLIGGAVIFVIAVTAELTNRNTNEEALSASSQAHDLAAGLSRQRSAMVAMGLAQNARKKWRGVKDIARELNLHAGAREGLFTAAARSARQILQVLVLGAGAALAIRQEISPGAIVAASIVLSRALAPVDQIVGSWRAITNARSAWKQLSVAIESSESEEKFTPLPKPNAKLELNRLSVEVPGAKAPLIHPFSAEFKGGEMTSIIGGNGVGKTTLLQTLAGAWSPRVGTASLGGRSIHAWESVDRGQYVGYVPQNVELLPGTISENIARMTDADTDSVIAAAKKAGAHEMILSLAQGYDTPIGGANAGQLSAGQRQLIGLSRALFGQPVLLLLDEPTANLDPETSKNFIANLKNVAKQGAIIVMATHDKSLIAVTNNVLLIRNGSVLSADSDKYLHSTARRPQSSVMKIAAGAPT